jgi:tetratricopeptide (TPR) repeat protein
MAKFCDRKYSWTGMREVFSGLFKTGEIGKDRPLDWIRFYWSLSVGTEIAMISRVERESSGVLHVVVAGKEWIPVLESLERKIVRDMNGRVGADRLSRIVFTEGKVEPMEQNKVPPLFKNREKSGVPRLDLEPMEGNLAMIKDEGLREILARLGKKLQYLPLVGFLLLASCAAVPATRNPALSDSQDVMRFIKQNGDKQRDSKAYYYYLKALSAERANDFEEAAEHLARLIKNDPKIEKFYPQLAGFYLRTGQFDKGIALCRTALELFPRNEELRAHMADMLSATDQKDEALEHYLKAIEHDPGNIRSHLLAGNIYFEKKQYELAQELFRKTLILEANNPLGLFYLGKVFLQNEDFFSARDNFRRAVLLRPNFQEAREHLASVLEKLGAHKEALGEYEMILKLNPENARVGEYLAYLSKTKTPFQGASDFKPLDSSPHVKLGTIYYEQALYLKTIDEFRLIKDKEISFTLHMVIAKIYELFGRFDKSIKEMEILRQEQPRSVDILLQIALFYSMNGQQKEALNMVQTATQIEPENDQLQHSLALAYMSLHQDDLAIKSLIRAIELNSGKESYYFELGSLQEKLGKIDDAVKNMKKVIELNPDHSNAHNFLGYIYSLQGVNLNEAVGHLEKALLIQPQNGYFLDSLGWIYYKKGEPEKAIVEMKKAMIYTPPDPILYDHLGDIYYALKNYEEALKAWKSSLQLIKRKKVETGGELVEPGKIEEKIRKVQRHLEKSL